jgi:TonB-linked SusC/RagA family outer membrane protein
MRLNYLLLSLVLLLMARTGNAQTISLSVKNVRIEKVFTLIEKQAGVMFFYRVESLRRAHNVTMKITNASLTTALKQCFDTQPLQYEIIDKTVVVKEKPAASSLLNPIPMHTSPHPSIEVRGRILTEQGEPVEGATISVKGKKKASQSDVKGRFSINVGDDRSAVLTVTSVAIEPAEVMLKNDTALTIIVNTKLTELDSVQIIGYGQTTKRLNTGNVTTIKAADIERQPVANVLAALQGQVPGLFISQNTGLPGSGFQTLIRGKGTLTGGSKPLVIVDGVPYTDINFTANNNYKQGQNGLGLLNTGEIERVEILKDADATAIYGSRGGNGVILITTKKGKPGVTSLDVNLYTGFGKLTTRPKLLNLKEWLELETETFRNDSITITPEYFAVGGRLDSSRYTDWSKELLGGTAHITDARLAMSGSSQSINYRIIGGYHSETSVMKLKGSDRRYLLHFHMAHAPAEKKYRIELSGTYQAGVDDMPPADFTPLLLQEFLVPNQPAPFLADGRVNDDPTFINPYRFRGNDVYKRNMNNLAGHLKTFWSPIRGLELSASLGYNTQSLNDIFSNRRSTLFVSTLQSSFGSNTVKTYILEPQALYSLNIKQKGKLSLLVGTTYQQTVFNYRNLKATGFANEALQGNAAAATTLTIQNERYSNYKYLGTFSRLSLNWANKYLVNLTGRVDGTSRFGPGKQFHPFGAIGAAWILSEEQWLHHRGWINLLKLRGSYGIVGNSDIPDYAFLNTYAPFLGAYQGIQGLTPSQLFDRNLGWELKKSLEFALELQLFKNRVGFSVSTYLNRNSQQLLQTPLPAVTGFYGVYENRPAEVENKGLEVVLDGTPVKSRNFVWSVTANASFQRNKLVRLDGIDDYYINGSRLAVGKPISSYRAYKYGGVDPQTGSFFFIDRKGNPSTQLTDEDRTEYVDLAPRSYGGITNSFSYKQFSLDIHSLFMVRNSHATYGYPPYLKEHMARWQKPGDVTNVPKLTHRYSIPVMGYYQLSTAFYRDASYFRVRNIALSYNVPNTVLQRWRLQKLRLYVLGQNLFTLTKVKNLDPETMMLNSMAPSRVITAGFQISF